MIPLIGLGCLLLIAGAAAWIGHHGLQRTRADMSEAKARTVKELTEMAAAETRPVGGETFRLYCEVNGIGGCVEPVRSKIKNEPCLCYLTTVSREYEEHDDQGSRTRTDRVYADRRHAAFWVQDGTGRISVDASGAEVDMVGVFEDYIRSKDVGGELTVGGITIGGKLTVGGFTWTVHTPSDVKTLGYWVRERVLPAGRRLYILGEVTDAGGTLHVAAPSEPDRHFIVSLRTEQELAEEISAKAKFAKAGAVVLAALGVFCILGGLVVWLLGGS